MSTIKQVVDSLVAAGTPLADIIRQVNVAAVDKALVMNYGNQTKAAQQLKCHRSIVRKYTMVRQEKPMVGRWRDNTGEQPCRRSAIEIEYNDGSSEVTYANKVDWSIDLTLNKVMSGAPLIRRWRPWYA